MFDKKPPTYIDDQGCTVIGTRPASHIERLGKAVWQRYERTVEVSCSDVRDVLEDFHGRTSEVRSLEREVASLRTLLAEDADWRRRADHEPLRSVVAALLGACKPPRQGLYKDETPHALASRVVKTIWELRYKLADEYKRQSKIIIGKTAGLGLVDVSDAKKDRYIP